MHHSLIHSNYFYSPSSSPLLLLPRGIPDTARMLCQSFTPKRHRQLRVKDLPKVPTWRPERDSNPRPFGRKAMNLLKPKSSFRFWKPDLEFIFVFFYLWKIA